MSRLKLFKSEAGDWTEVSLENSTFATTFVCSNCSRLLKTELSHLEPDTAYSVYAVEPVSNLASDVSRFRTAPTQMRKIVFGISGSFGKRNPIWASLNNASLERLDFFVLGGDSIFAPFGAGAANYSASWDSALSSPMFRNLASSTSFIATQADGEVGDVAWASASSNPFFVAQASVGMQAFEDSIPIRSADPPRASGVSDYFRSFSFGPTLDVFVLDTRTERNLTQLVSDDQLFWLKASLTNSTARFKLVVSGVPFTDTSAVGAIFPYGSWSWYAAQRNAILDHIVATEIPGVIFASATARFGGYARVNATNPNTRWGVQSTLMSLCYIIQTPLNFSSDVTEILAGPAGTAVHSATVLNPSTAFATQFVSSVLDTWTYTRVELDPVTDEAKILFIDDTGQAVGSIERKFVRR